MSFCFENFEDLGCEIVWVFFLVYYFDYDSFTLDYFFLFLGWLMDGWMDFMSR